MKNLLTSKNLASWHFQLLCKHCTTLPKYILKYWGAEPPPEKYWAPAPLAPPSYATGYNYMYVYSFKWHDPLPIATNHACGPTSVIEHAD